MAKTYPPFMNATGNISRILEKIKVAATPDRFTQDFLATELGFSGGSSKPFIPLAKKMGLIGSDGAPTDLYKQFRNTSPSTSKSAMAKAIKSAYADVYARNEYAHSLSKQELEGLIVEITGLEKGSGTVRAITGTFEALKAFADFKVKPEIIEDKSQDQNESLAPPKDPEARHKHVGKPLPIGISYTINLVLPKTEDVAVFNAIFKSLRENLLNE
jgi:hypothetical protein